MRERQRGKKSVKWGTQVASASSTLWVILAFFAVAYGGYKAWGWWTATDSVRALSVAPAVPAVRRPATHPNFTGNWDPQRLPIPGTPAAPGTVVIKCVVNGATTYVASQADCAAQAKTTIVKIDPKQNLSDGLPNAEQIIRQPSPRAHVDVPPAGVDPNVQRQAICQAHEREIKWIDVRALLVVNEWRRLAADARRSRALVFCVSVAHAEFMTAWLNRAGIPAACVVGTTPSDERRLAPQRLASGELSALVTVDLYNEGVDLPSVDTLLLLRPTQSPVLFQQQIGRGLPITLRKASDGFLQPTPRPVLGRLECGVLELNELDTPSLDYILV
jgi:hypothetical protein